MSLHWLTLYQETHNTLVPCLLNSSVWLKWLLGYSTFMPKTSTSNKLIRSCEFWERALSISKVKSIVIRSKAVCRCIQDMHRRYTLCLEIYLFDTRYSKDIQLISYGPMCFVWWSTCHSSTGQCQILASWQPRSSLFALHPPQPETRDGKTSPLPPPERQAPWTKWSISQ